MGVPDKVAWAIEILNQYAPEKLAEPVGAQPVRGQSWL